MSTYFKASLAGATALTLMCAPALSAAALSSSVPWSPSSLLAAGMLPTSSMLEALNQSQAPTGNALVAASETSPAPSKFALRSSAFGELQGSAQLLLWNLCSIVKAQQKQQHFAALDRGIYSVSLNLELAPALDLVPASAVSAVPLPGAIWLFVMGVMGLAGAKVTGTKRSKADTVDAAHQPTWLAHGTAATA